MHFDRFILSSYLSSSLQIFKGFLFCFNNFFLLLSQLFLLIRRSEPTPILFLGTRPWVLIRFFWFFRTLLILSCCCGSSCSCSCRLRWCRCLFLYNFYFCFLWCASKIFGVKRWISLFHLFFCYYCMFEMNKERIYILETCGVLNNDCYSVVLR